MKTRILLSCALLAFLCNSHAAIADTTFSDDFSGPFLNPNLEITNGYTGYSITGDIGNTSSTRNYVRTVDADYGDFEYEITLNHTQFDGGGIAFVGIGSGLPDPTFSNEPGNGSLMFRLHNPALVSGRVDLAFWGPGDDHFSVIENYNVFNQPLRFQIRREGDLLTMGYDKFYNGTYSSDFQQTFDLSTTQYSNLKTSLDSESRMFFGAGSAGTRFDDISVTSLSAIPEPSCGMLGFAVVALGFFRRRR